MFVAQSPLSITNSVTTGTAGSPITLTSAGGSGTIAVSFAVSGTGCSLVGDVLSTTGTDTCVVTATNAANGIYASTTSPAVSVHFSLAAQRALRVRAVRHAGRAAHRRGFGVGTTERSRERLRLSPARVLSHREQGHPLPGPSEPQRLGEVPSAVLADVHGDLHHEEALKSTRQAVPRSRSTGARFRSMNDRF